MKMRLKTEGASQAVLMLATMTTEGRSAKVASVRDTGKMVEKELRRVRATSEGLNPLGRISRALGHKKPWGKSKFTTYVLKRTGTAIITTKGMNKKMEEGGIVTVSDQFKKYLHTLGIHIKKSTKTGKILARPLFARTWEKVKSKIIPFFEARFHYNLGRALRRWRIK